MREINVFISQPMNGRPLEYVLCEREEILDSFRKWGISAGLIEEDDLLVDVNENFGEPVPDKGRLYYLGRSIQNMEDADYVIFVTGYEKAKGCLVEHTAATRYFDNSIDATYRRPNPEPVWIDGNEFHKGRITSLIDEIFFNRCY